MRTHSERRVNCITRAMVETDPLRKLTPEAMQFAVSRIQVGRIGTSRDVASLVAWLSSVARSLVRARSSTSLAAMQRTQASQR